MQKRDQTPEKVDVWRKIEVLSQMLVPIAIFVGGILIAQSDRDQTIELKQNEQTQDQAVEVAKLMHSFKDDLIGPDGPEKEVAILALLKAGENLEEFLDAITQ